MIDKKIKVTKAESSVSLDAAELRSASGSTPLITPEQEQGWVQKLKKLDTRWSKDRVDYNKYSKTREQIKDARLAELTDLVQERSDEYLDGLLVMVGSRGARSLDFFSAFALSADPALRKDIEEHDTPENRRILHSMLEALGSIPSNWNDLDYRRFLTSRGEQAKAKYKFPGKGILKKSSGWQDGEVGFVCAQLAGEKSLYAEVLRVHDQTADGIDLEPAEERVRGPEVIASEDDFDIVEATPSYSYYPEPKPDILRNSDFIAKLCEKLKERGLAKPPKAVRKSSKAKVFEEGDIISKANLKDLPLPAHIRATMERRASTDDPWRKGLVEQVITGLNNDGSYAFSWVTPGELAAYADPKTPALPQQLVQGAMFLGPWKGDQTSGCPAEYEFEIKLP